MPVRLPCGEEKVSLVRPVEIGAVDRAGEIGDEHPARLARSRAMPMPSIRWVNTISGFGARRWRRSARGSPYCRAAGRPGRSSRARGSRDRDRDRSAQAGCRRAVRCRVRFAGVSTFRDIDVRRERCGPRPRCRRPSGSSRICLRIGDRWRCRRTISLDRARPGSPSARVDEGLDLRAVEIGAHHAHAFAVAPVELAVLLFDLELLRRERAARSNDGRSCFSVEIRAERWSRRLL